MKGLVLVAHGSRRPASNDEVRALSKQLETKVSDIYGCVVAGFLELAEPLIPDAIDLCVEAGADEVIIMPYFLSAGRHVTEDIPRIVSQHQRDHHPSVAIHINRYLGANDAMSAWIMDSLSTGQCMCDKAYAQCDMQHCKFANT